MEYKIEVKERKESGTKACKELREQGQIPAVVYSEGKEATMISLETKKFEKVWKNAGESTVINLTGVGDDKSVLIQDVSQDPLYDTPLHVDFYAVRTDRVVTVDVPLTFDGVAPAVKDLGGNLVKVIRDFGVEALPKDLPSEIIVDISSLETFGDQIQVKDITLPSGVTATQDPDEVVALVQVAKEEEEPEAEETGDIADIEVEKKGKEDEGDGTSPDEGESKSE